MKPNNSHGKECAVVASLLAEWPDALPPTVGRLIQSAPESFADSRLGFVAVAMRDLQADGAPVNFVTVRQKLAALNGQFKDLPEFLAGLGADGALPIALAEAEAETLWPEYQTRQTKAVLSEALQTLDANPDLARSVIKHATSALGQLVESASSEVHAVTLAELSPAQSDDGSELLQNRFLCRHGSMLFVGRTGLGKSSLEMQMAILWALGSPCFGITPAAPLRSLIVQAENDAGDLAEMRNGIFDGLNLREAQRREAESRIQIATVDDVIGEKFVRGVLAPLARETKPDLIWIDPLLTYLGGDVNKQDVVSMFLRSWLMPVVHDANAAVIILHHTPKPPREQSKDVRAVTDFAYAGAGSSELANWPRAVITLEPMAQPGVFTLRLGKRGRRVGWTEPDGTTTSYTRTIAHGGNGLIYWRELAGQDAILASVAPGANQDDVLKLVPMVGTVPKGTVINQAQDAGIGEKRAVRFIDELIHAGKLHVWTIKRPKTNPLKLLSRQPQPETLTQATNV